MGSGDNGVSVIKVGSILAEATERWGPVGGRVHKTCMRDIQRKCPCHPKPVVTYTWQGVIRRLV